MSRVFPVAFDLGTSLMFVFGDLDLFALLCRNTPLIRTTHFGKPTEIIPAFQHLICTRGFRSRSRKSRSKTRARAE